MIPILDLSEQYRALESELDAAIKGVLRGGHYIMGPNVKAFEEEIASYLGVAHAIGVNSGTDALHLALRALDIGAGDEVITSPFTFVATTEAIGIVGAKPVFVDIDPATFNLDPNYIEAAITSRTKAILPVHLYGLPVPMHAIREVAARYGLKIVEDCAQSIGATIDGVFTGTIGDAGAYSFFPSKNLGAYGDGGLVTTNDAKLAERLRSLRAHGGRVKYHHEELGLNSRLDELQAAILRVKLPRLESWIAARRAIAERYNEAFAGVFESQAVARDSRHVYHQYTIRVRDRAASQATLKDAGVQSMVYYPLPLHLQEVHRSLGLREGAFPHSERAAQEVLSLPIFPELGEERQAQVIAAVLQLSKVEAPA